MSALLTRLKAVKPAWWLSLALVLCVLACVLPGSENADISEIERALSRIQGAGAVRVVVQYAQESGGFGASGAKTPQGAVVVAEGAGDMEVRLMLLRAAQSLLGLPLSRIEVFPMEELP